MIFSLLRNLALLFIILRSGHAHSDIRDSQSMQPIAWEPDFTNENTLSLSWLHLPDGLPFLTTPDHPDAAAVKNIFGIQLGRTLRERWLGRVGVMLAQEGARRGDHVWSFIGSDLQYTGLFPSKEPEQTILSFRPHIFFGLGVLSRWENSITRYNLVPTARYEASEPSAYGGVAFQFRFARELILEIEGRYFQSARVSMNRGLSVGGSLVWGGW
jgi:hypothetical protein